MKINVENRLVLDKFQPRPYQAELWHAIENLGYKKVLMIAPRRAGKDITAWNLAIRHALRKTCLIYYCAPTYSQCRKIIWDAISISGDRFLDFIPASWIKSKNSQMMQIVLQNNSIIQLIGSDNYHTSLVGTNPSLIVFSEWSRCREEAYHYARPILAANGGVAVFVTTPFGKNHCWNMWKIAQELDDWYVIYKKTSEINHIPEEALLLEKAQMSPELYAQEYECDWLGVDGSYYAKIINEMYENNQITTVPYEHGLSVYTAWDIGVSDATTIVFFQIVGRGEIIRIIDCYTNNNVGLEDYIKVINSKPYVYVKHFAPHDIKVREWGGGALTRLEMARQLGLNFSLVEHYGVQEGIELVRKTLPKCWIDEKKCTKLISALENYYREWDDVRKVYKDKPFHSWASHFCDAVRLMACALPKTTKGLTKDEMDKAKAQALYGNKQLPWPFNHS